MANDLEKRRGCLALITAFVLGWVTQFAVIGVVAALWGIAGLVVAALVKLGLAMWLAVRRRRTLAKVKWEGLKTDVQVTDIVKAISASAKRTPPRAFVVTKLQRHQYQAAALMKPPPGIVLVTTSTVKDLTEAELKAILAHELAHIWYTPRLVPPLIVLWGVVATVLFTFLSAFALYGTHLRVSTLVASWWAVVAIVLLWRALANLPSRALSRYCEYRADAWACSLGCDGACLAFALWEATAREAAAQSAARRRSPTGSARRRAPKVRGIYARVMKVGPVSRRRSWTALERRKQLMELCRGDLLVNRLFDHAISVFSTHPAVQMRTQRLLAIVRGPEG